MTRIAIIADDLTGALDAAAPFAAIDGGARVATSLAALPRALANGPGVVAVSTRSRDMTDVMARDAVAQALDALPAGTRLFKKVDSRLKGPIAAELAAFGARKMLVAPAIPELGRYLRDGAVCGFGAETPIPVEARLGEAATRSIIPDIVSAADIQSVLEGLDPAVLLVGARSLAAGLARQWVLQPKVGPVPLAPPLAIVVGSTDPITLAQVTHLTRSRNDLRAVLSPAGEVPADATAGPVTLWQITGGPKTPPARAGQRFAEGLAPHLRRAASIVMTGGATAEACLDALGLDCLEVLGEFATGLPISRAGGKTLITKSGGFGTPKALLALTSGTPHVTESMQG